MLIGKVEESIRTINTKKHEYFHICNGIFNQWFLEFCVIYRLVFFMDARLDSLQRVNYDGTGRMTVLQKSAIKHPFAMTSFEDFIYFSDWNPPAGIVRVNKFTGGGKTIAQQRLNKPMSLKVVHPALQQNAVNYCLTHNCSHLCVLRPSGHSCRCPFGMELKSDKIECQCESNE